MANKFTKREFFTAIKALVTNEDVQQVCQKKVVFGANEAIFMTVIADFCDHEIELLNKKHSSGSRKPTKTQVENEGHKATIMEVLINASVPLTIKEIQSNVLIFLQIYIIQQMVDVRLQHPLIALFL